MSDDWLVVVDVDGRADLYHFDPYSEYEGIRLADGTIVLLPIKEPGPYARRFKPRPALEPTAEDYAAAEEIRAEIRAGRLAFPETPPLTSTTSPTIAALLRAREPGHEG